MIFVGLVYYCNIVRFNWFIYKRYIPAILVIIVVLLMGASIAFFFFVIGREILKTSCTLMATADQGNIQVLSNLKIPVDN